MSVLDDLLAAGDAPATLRHVARGEWAKAHDGAECPPERIPAPGALAGWLPECPDAARDEAGALLAPLFEDRPATWQRVRVTFEAAHALYAFVEADEAVPGSMMAPDGSGGYVPVIGADLNYIHAKWRTMPEPRPRHPAAPLVAAWQAAQPIERDRRRHGIAPDSWRDARYHDHLPLLQRPYPEAPGKMAGDQHLLPLVELETPSVVVPVLPLALYDSGAGPLATRGRGAPYAQRLFVEILLDVGRLDRVPGQTARVEVPLRDLVAWLWPKRWHTHPLRRPPR